MALVQQNMSSWKESLKAAQKHTAAQGEIIHAANLLQDEFFKLFLTALSLERPDRFGAKIRFYSQAIAIWHVIQSDSSQREMALAAIATVPSSLKLGRPIKALEWAKKSADLLARYRNIVAHNPVMFTVDRRKAQRKRLSFIPVFGGHGSRPSHRGVLALIDGLGLWRTVRNDLLRLTAYVAQMIDQIDAMEIRRLGAEVLSGQKSWPSKPQLRSVSRIQEIDRRIAQSKSRPSRHTRRQSSPW